MGVVWVRMGAVRALYGCCMDAYGCIWVLFEEVALACPGSATDVIRGLGRKVGHALGVLAGSKQGLVPLPGQVCVRVGARRP